MKQVIVDGICLPKTLKCASFGMTIPRIAKYFNILEISFSCETDFFVFHFWSGEFNSVFIFTSLRYRCCRLAPLGESWKRNKTKD